MANKRGAYLTTIFIFLLVGLFITSFFVPFKDKSNEWIPLLSGFVEMDALYGNRLLLVIGGMISIATLAISIYFVNSKSFGNSLRMYYTQLFFLFIILINPMSIYFSTVYPAAILLTWMQYCFIIRQRFTAFFLLALASLFYAPVIWVVPIVLIISIIGSPDIIRAFLKSFGGIMIPYLYTLVFRYIYFNDVDEFIRQYLDRVTKFEIPIYSLNFTTIFLILCFFIIILHSIVFVIRKLNRQNILAGYILRMELVISLLSAFFFLVFWRGDSLPLCVIIAGPFSLILSNYFTSTKGYYSLQAEFVLLISAAAIVRASYFIN